MLYRVLLIVAGLLSVSTAHAQISRLPHADTTRGNAFGISVAISGDRVLVGASGEDACGANSGAAYVYERSDSTGLWIETGRLVAADCRAGTFFGRSLDLDGDRAVIAAAGEFFSLTVPNAAYVFERDSTGTWQQVDKLRPDSGMQEGGFASSVSLDGDQLLVTASGDNTDGAYGGAAYVFERQQNGRWIKQARLESPGALEDGIFGGTGRISGDRLAVAASTYFQEKPGSVYLFNRDPDGNWRFEERIGGVRDFFISLDLQGDLLLVGERKAGRRQSGRATLYRRADDGEWRQESVLTPRTAYALGAFGSLVSLSEDHVLAAGYDEQLQMDFNIDRVAFIFGRDEDTGEWSQRRIVDIGEVAFGASLDHDGRYAVIGQAGDNEPGAAYVVWLP
ncbi:MAG: FG-GAP repeat protein [Rhodothermales bacterium]